MHGGSSPSPPAALDMRYSGATSLHPTVVVPPTHPLPHPHQRTVYGAVSGSTFASQGRNFANHPLLRGSGFNYWPEPYHFLINV